MVTSYFSSLSFCALCGIILDVFLGEPRRWHPLVGFGNWASKLERQWNLSRTKITSRWRGLSAWVLCVIPVCVVALAIAQTGYGRILDVLLLYFSIGARSLCEHGLRVADDLDAQDLIAARKHVGWMVSRDTSTLDEAGISKAAIESILENGNDAIFGTLFWFMLLGGSGALLFRLSNTLDAMWGYRNDQYLHFGWAAARIDDALNFIPARLTAMTYALLGHTPIAWRCWQTQAPQWDSPNAGPVMASGAGALNLRLGGTATYQGHTEDRPALGTDVIPIKNDIRRSVRLVRQGVALWVSAICVGGWFIA